jgi:hypothetical protein
LNAALEIERFQVAQLNAEIVQMKNEHKTKMEEQRKNYVNMVNSMKENQRASIKSKQVGASNVSSKQAFLFSHQSKNEAILHFNRDAICFIYFYQLEHVPRNILDIKTF